jgi:hypothetical protein
MSWTKNELNFKEGGRRPGGKVLPSCAGCLLFDADVLGHLDLRITLETQDGAHIYVQ